MHREVSGPWGLMEKKEGENGLDDKKRAKGKEGGKGLDEFGKTGA